ncbi:MAG: hypothetical protein AB3N20_13010 [Rhizobiaceae bacterium]
MRASLSAKLIIACFLAMTTLHAHADIVRVDKLNRDLEARIQSGYGAKQSWCFRKIISYVRWVRETSEWYVAYGTGSHLNFSHEGKRHIVMCTDRGIRMIRKNSSGAVTRDRTALYKVSVSNRPSRGWPGNAQHTNKAPAEYRGR